MKQLQKETNTSTQLECAALIMEVVPRVMQRIRREMRCHGALGLSVPQLCTLIYLYRNEGASLSEVADHIGLRLPSMSKTVDALVARKLVIRKALAHDRRYVSLRLSAQGLAELMRTRRVTEASLAEELRVIPTAQQARIAEALKMLGQVFSTETIPLGKESR